MADIKKYLDTTALGTLVDQIKSEDAKVLAAAKKYTDDAASSYDAAGSAATAESNAKAYTDALANGQVKTNKEDIATLKGDASTEGSVAKAVADAKALVDADVDAVEAIANQNKTDIAAINNAESGILAQAKKYADDEDAKVEQAVADLETYVGTIPATATAKDIVGYVQEKTSGIATDTALEELTGRVKTAEDAIDAIEADYLKAADKTELEGKITAVETAVATEKSRAEGIEAGLESRLATVEGDYLKAADKKELQDNIDTLSGVVETLSDGIDPDKVDGVKDLIAYVEEHGPEVTGMKEDISDNAEAIEGVAGRMDTAEGKISALETASALHAEKTYVDEAIETLEGADTGLSNRISAIEDKFKEGEGSVSDMIADAKQEAIDTAAGDATSKANAAEKNAKDYADGLDEAMNTRVEALEAIDHDHSNKAELDLIASGDKAKWDEAYAKRHEHANSAELDKIASGDVAKWNAAEQNAKDYADGLDEAMTTKVDGIDGRVKTLEDTIVDKAEKSALEAAIERIAQNETDIAANLSAINSFTPITSDEVNALFA